MQTTQEIDLVSPMTNDTVAAASDPSLDRIAAALKAEVHKRLEALEVHLADASRLAQVARTLGNGAVLADLEAGISGYTRQRDEMIEAQLILGSRRCPEPSARADEPAVSDDPLPPVAEAQPDGAAPSVVAESPADADSSPTEAPDPPTVETPPTVEAPVVLWSPRPLEILEEECEAVEAAVAALQAEVAADFARFKRECSRFRGAFAERRRLEGSQDAWHALRQTLWDILRTNWPDEYCIPVNSNVELEPERWLQLSDLYDALACAIEAFDWIETQVDFPPNSSVSQDCSPLIEAVGAATATLHQWLRHHLPNQRDDQQQALYYQLLDLGSAHTFFIRSLQIKDRIEGDEGPALAEEIQKHFEAIRVRTAREAAQVRALAQLSDLLQREDFGSGDDDDDQLCEAACRCLDEGIRPTDKRLRDALLEFPHMLEDDARLARLHKAVVDELQRRENKSAVAGRTSKQNDIGWSGDLPSHLKASLEKVLSTTKGLKGLVVGGTCREDTRLAIEQALQLRELGWPNTEPSDPFERIAKQIARSDLVFLTRFNRQHSRAAIKLCRDQGKQLIRLPKGYGLHEVIAQTHRQLFQRDCAS